jgi:hypothetical protein
VLSYLEDGKREDESHEPWQGKGKEGRADT